MNNEWPRPENGGIGWRVIEGTRLNPRDAGDWQVWYGTVLIRDGLLSRELAEVSMLQRAKEEAQTAEENWVRADNYRTFCRAELVRLAALLLSPDTIP